MPTSSRIHRAVLILLVLGTTIVPVVGVAEQAPLRRPSPIEACTAWREHISDLIDQHRLAADLSEIARFEFILQFNAARDACSRGSYDMGATMYDEIRLGRAHATLK
jgi:hypothetical protein